MNRLPARKLLFLPNLTPRSDYRHYEIYEEVDGKPPIPLSEYRTGSGGQLETPAYIIRSAAITSAFRFAAVNTHPRMALVGEAFSKMDETRYPDTIRERLSMRYFMERQRSANLSGDGPPPLAPVNGSRSPMPSSVCSSDANTRFFQ